MWIMVWWIVGTIATVIVVCTVTVIVVVVRWLMQEVTSALDKFL